MERFLKLRLVLLSTGSVMLLAILIYAGATAGTYWIETHHETYPWRHEDNLRYLLPSLHAGRGVDRILLIGPSEAREGLIYQRFDQAFPGMDAFQGGQRLGTFNDVLLILDYMARVYGPGTMPHTLVLGITPRFVSNIPRDFSSMAMTIDRYSPYFRVQEQPDGLRLVAKTPWEGFRSRVRFLSKQGRRYSAAMATLVDRFLDDDLPYAEFDPEVFSMTRAASGKSPGQIAVSVLTSAWDMGPGTALGRLTRLYISPYKYHHLAPISKEAIRGWLYAPRSFWFKARQWNPADDALLIRREFDQLLTLAARWNIRLYVVNLPEHPLVRETYKPGYYDRYLEAVQASLQATPFLNLRDIIPADGFYDAGHLNLPSALRVTDRVIDFMKSHGFPRTSPGA